jgi:hypothetical protein
MRMFVTVVGLIAAGIVALIAIYELGYTQRYRYRLTLEVAVGDEVKVGSGVIEVVDRLDFVPGRPLKYTTTFIGEAVHVDLGARGKLFVLVKSADPFDAGWLASKAFFATPTSASREEHEQRFELIKRWAAQRATAELHPKRLPTLVTFKNIDDPSSVVGVDPEDLTAAFGPGVQLRRASVQLTTDPVTTGIGQVLPWLDEIKRKRITLEGQSPGARSGLRVVDLESSSFRWRTE